MSASLTIRHMGIDDPALTLTQQWREKRGLQPVPENFLPRSGAVVESDGEVVAASWLHMSNSVGVCWIENFAIKPGIHHHRKVAIARKLILALMIMAKQHDYGVILAYCDDEVANMAIKAGDFLELGKNLTMIGRRVE